MKGLILAIAAVAALAGSSVAVAREHGPVVVRDGGYHHGHRHHHRHFHHRRHHEAVVVRR